MPSYAAQYWISCIKEKRRVKRDRSRQNAKIKIKLCESASKVKSGGARELARLLITRHKFVCFDVTVDIDCAISFLCLARYCGHKCSVTHRVLKSDRYFNRNISNTLIRITFILTVFRIWGVGRGGGGGSFQFFPCNFYKWRNNSIKFSGF